MDHAVTTLDGIRVHSMGKRALRECLEPQVHPLNLPWHWANRFSLPWALLYLIWLQPIV